MTPTNIEDQLVRDEEEVLHGYFDDEGYLTIGVGILIDKRRGGGISQDESRYLLRNRIAAKKAELVAKIPWATSLDDARFGALLNMAFNLGVDGVLEFQNFLGFLKGGLWDAAAGEMLNSLWKKQVGERADRLAQQIRTGTWQ